MFVDLFGDQAMGPRALVRFFDQGGQFKCGLRLLNRHSRRGLDVISKSVDCVLINFNLGQEFDRFARVIPATVKRDPSERPRFSLLVDSLDQGERCIQLLLSDDRSEEASRIA
jgi:hypothetical protein